MKVSLENISLKQFYLLDSDAFKKEMFKYSRENMLRVSIYLRYQKQRNPSKDTKSYLTQGPLCCQVQARPSDHYHLLHRQLWRSDGLVYGLQHCQPGGDCLLPRHGRRSRGLPETGRTERQERVFMGQFFNVKI